MNTLSLQENFPEVYNDFYSRNNLVLSWHFSLPWGPGWYWLRSDFAFITSKINLKCFIWFKKIKENKVIFLNITSYDIVKNDYVVNSFSSISKEEKDMVDLIKNIFNINDFWVEIEILSETTRGHSFWFFWTFSAILSTGLYLLNNKITSDTLVNYNDFCNSKEFTEIFEKWLKLEIINRYWNTIWQTILSTLKNNKWPSYLVSNKIEDVNFSYQDLNLKNEYFLEKYKDDLVTEDLPFDYCMVFSWLKTETKNIELYKTAWEKDFTEISDFIKSDITTDNYDFLSKFINKNSINTNYTSNVSILSAKIIMILSRIYTSWYNQNLIVDFIDTINQFRYGVSLIEKQSLFAEDFIYSFKKNIINIDEQLGIMPIYSWKIGWGYLLITKYWISRDTINNSLIDLKKIYPNVEIEHSSYNDWESSNWIIIEQNISEWIYSKYIDKTKFIYNNINWNSYIWEYSDILLTENKWLLFDLINNKIYLEWVKLTSKDIHSQTTTIEVVILLLDNIWKEISNKDLLVSSYSRNKNEMVWKIILPFLKLIENKTWYKLNIECKWSIGSYFLKISNINLQIWTVDRI